MSSGLRAGRQPWPCASPGVRWPLVAIATGGAAAALGVGAAASRWAPELGQAALVAVLALAVGIAAAVAIAVEIRRGNPFSPAVAIALFALFFFCARPLYLVANIDRLGAYRLSSSTGESLTDIQSQEITLFLTEQFSGSVAGLFLEVMVLGVIFLAAFFLGYYTFRSPRAPEERPPPRERRGRPPSETRLAAVVLGMVLISLAAQSLILARVGGVSGALDELVTQRTLNVSFLVLLLANLSFGAVLVWIAVRPPTSVGGWVVLWVVIAEQTLFGFATGSRSKSVILAAAAIVAIHYAVRRWRLRELVAMMVVVLVISPTILAIRQATSQQTFGGALVTGLREGPSLGSILNDSSAFDTFAQLVAIVPEELPHQNGRRLFEGVASGLLPDVLYPGDKPESISVRFRRLIVGERFGAGRPYTLPGELWFDFRIWGLVLGGLALGIGSRLLNNRLWGAAAGRRPVFVAFYPAVLVSLSVLLQGTWDLGTAVALLCLFPVALGVALLGGVSAASSPARLRAE